MHKINTKGQVAFGSCIFNNKTSSLSPRYYEFIYVMWKIIFAVSKPIQLFLESIECSC